MHVAYFYSSHKICQYFMLISTSRVERLNGMKHNLFLNIGKAIFRRIYSWCLSDADNWKNDSRIVVGVGTYGLKRSLVQMSTSRDRLIIGNYCSIGPGVRFVCEGHLTDSVSTFPFRTLLCESVLGNVDSVSRGPVILGNDVWIGANAIILSGVTVGHGAIVGAGAIVTRDLPPYSLAVGAPARAVRLRFEPEQISALLKIAWWNWPECKVKNCIDDFYLDIDSFIATYAHDV